MISTKQNIDFSIVLTLALLVAGSILHIHMFFVLAIVSLLAIAICPVLYTPFSWLWFKISKFLEMIFSKILLVGIFYIIVTPVGVFRRWFANDYLQIHCFKKSNKSVFIVKTTTYKKENIENQF